MGAKGIINSQSLPRFPRTNSLKKKDNQGKDFT